MLSLTRYIITTVSLIVCHVSNSYSMGQSVLRDILNEGCGRECDVTRGGADCDITLDHTPNGVQCDLHALCCTVGYCDVFALWFLIQRNHKECDILDITLLAFFPILLHGIWPCDN